MKLPRFGRTWQSTALLASFLRFRPTALEFSRIDGAVPFALSIFVDNFQPILDEGNVEPDKEFSMNDHAFHSFLWIFEIIFSVLRNHPAVQNLIWDANITEMLVGLLKLRLTFGNQSSGDFDFKFMLVIFLPPLLVASARERNRFRELGGVELIQNINSDMFANQEENMCRAAEISKMKILELFVEK